MKKILFLTFIVAALLVFTQATAFACSCIEIPEPFEQKVKSELKGAKAVLSGMVLQIKDKPQSFEVFVTIKVERVWKGSVSKEVIITTENNNGVFCGYPFKVGESYLVYADGSDENNLTTSHCLRNLELQKAAEDLKILGKGKKPRKRNV
jgi:hypothetical protein